MQTFFTTNIGRLRLIAFLEGVSLLVLVGIGMPMKYAYNDPGWVKSIGPVHGLFFVFFVFNTISVSIDYHWKFTETSWKVLLASFIPFGTFYIDHQILAPIHKRKSNS